MAVSRPRQTPRAYRRGRLPDRRRYRRDTVARHLAPLPLADGGCVMSMDASERVVLDEVTQFIYREARLQDDHEYDAWEALWTDDGIYWIPANGQGTDPENEM